jgi:hypothetical protein
VPLPLLTMDRVAPVSRGPLPCKEIPVRRFAMLLSLSLVVGLSGATHLFAQNDAKKDEPKKDASAPAPKPADAKTDEAKKEEPKKEEPKKDEPKKEETPAPIPPEVEKKLDAARRAVAEAIVAAQYAGLVKTTIDPPPILDILITGRANDEATLKGKTGVSPEVFGAWFTGHNKPGQSYDPMKDVRITQPSAGLKTWYDQRARIFNTEIEAARKRLGTPAKPAAAAEPKKEEAKKEETKAAEPKKEESKAAEPKKEEPKKEETKK